MKLISGAALIHSNYFSHGIPEAQGSSFDLSIGKIVDEKGQIVSGPFVLKPGHMVQVISEEIFNLPNNVTGHVTYKTGLTRQGIWALTVGIVDPGWDGPIATTLLNFSRVDHAVNVGDKFLRVSLFEHDHVLPKVMRTSGPLPKYLKEVQGLAASRFPSTFLNSEQISDNASKIVMSKFKEDAVKWVTIAAFIFAFIQILAPPAAKLFENMIDPPSENKIVKDVDDLEKKIEDLERKLASHDYLAKEIVALKKNVKNLEGKLVKSQPRAVEKENNFQPH